MATAPSSLSSSVLMKRRVSHLLRKVITYPNLSYLPHVAFTWTAFLAWFGGWVLIQQRTLGPDDVNPGSKSLAPWGSHPSAALGSHPSAPLGSHPSAEMVGMAGRAVGETMKRKPRQRQKMRRMAEVRRRG